MDECTRWTFHWMYAEHSTYSSADFLICLVKAFPAPIREIQTDNGREFTNAYISEKTSALSLFEKSLKRLGIGYFRIRVATPRHNGKVERQHRIDQQCFYDKMRMYRLSNGLKQLQAYNRKSNEIPKICLDFLSPNQMMEKYLSVF